MRSTLAKLADRVGRFREEAPFFFGIFGTMIEPATTITALLVRARDGDRAALDILTPIVYDQLRQIAARHVAGERPGFSLCATEVVHEAYQKLAGADVNWQNRSHFLAVASRQMRQVLVDHARGKGRQKRGGDGWQRVTLNEVGGADEQQVDIIAIEVALDKLAGFDPRKAELVDMMVFGGLTGKDISEVLGIPEPTVWREWRVARAWLANELKSA